MTHMARFTSVIDLRRSLLRLLCFLVLLELIAVATGLVIAMQATRSDSPAADAALVMLSDDRGDQLRLDRAQQLLADGDVSRIVLAGREVDSGMNYLEQHGVPMTALIRAQAPSNVVQIADAQRALAQTNLGSVLVIAEPSQMLRLLKIARDTGLQARSLPLGTDNELSAGELVTEVGRYYWYVMAGQ